MESQSRSRCLVVGYGLFAVLLAGCLSEGEPLLEPAALSILSPANGIRVPARSRLALNAAVLSGNGEDVPRAAVLWSIASQPGADAALSDSVTVSDGTGVAQVELQLGSMAGATTVLASLEVDPSRFVVFSVDATASPVLTGISPTTFGGGVVLTVNGSDLDLATAFTVNGVWAELLSVSVAGDVATITVPPCLAPGNMPVRALLDDVQSQAIFGDFVGAPDTVMLQVGEHRSFSAASLAWCATFPAAGPGGAEYLLAPQATSGTPGDSTLYRLAVDPTAAPDRWVDRESGPPTGISHEEGFHRLLRDLERDIASLPRPPSAAAPSAVSAAVPQVGDRRNFEVCAKLPCGSINDFETVRAEAKFVGQHAVIFQDLNAPEGGLTLDDFVALGSLYDAELYDVAANAFGAESDVDDDGRVAILLTPVVNGLTPKETCANSFIAGFFFAIDINPGSASDLRSNQAEVFFAIVPDPSGTVTCSFTVDRVRRQVPVTFIHEFQHMINFHQHVLLRGGDPETLWLNEGMSHLSEELAALHFRDIGDSTRFSEFAIGDVINAYDYLIDTEAAFVLAEAGTGLLVERGAAWLFLRWLVDQYGDDVIRRLSETGLAGAASIESSTGAPMSRLLSEWFQANWLSDLPDSVLADVLKDPRLRYTTWSFRRTFASLNLQSVSRFPLPFPIVPEQVTPPFLRDGVLRAGSGDYYQLTQGVGGSAFTVQFTLPTGGPFATAAPRLNMVRIR